MCLYSYLLTSVMHATPCTGEILDAGVNRSPSAYLNNPSEERSKYKYDVDKEMNLLKFVDEEWGSVGSFNWFATHGTSMSRTNSLISGDNKGAAARFMEDWLDGKDDGNVYSDKSHTESTERIPRRISNIIPEYNDKRKYQVLFQVHNVLRMNFSIVFVFFSNGLGVSLQLQPLMWLV